MSYSGEGNLTEAQIIADPKKTVVPVVCDSQGRLIVTAAAGSSVIGTVEITDSNGAPLLSSNGSLDVNIVPTTNFDYVAGSLTSAGSIVGFGNCKGIRVYNSGNGSASAAFAISGGTPIILRAGQLFQIIPQGELLNPTIDWFSGSIDVWMEVEGALPPTIADLGLSLGIAHL